MSDDAGGKSALSDGLGATPFDAAIGAYAKACWHHDEAGMRAGYVKLRDLFAAQHVAALSFSTAYRCCAKHEGQTYTMTAKVAPPARYVCPLCEPLSA